MNTEGENLYTVLFLLYHFTVQLSEVMKKTLITAIIVHIKSVEADYVKSNSFL